MKNIEISIEGQTEIIMLNKLSRVELEHMLKIALEFENYEMCSNLKKYIGLLCLKCKIKQ